MVPTVLNLPSSAATVGGSSIHTLLKTHSSNSTFQLHTFHLKFPNWKTKFTSFPSLSCYSESNISPAEISSPPEMEVDTIPPPVVKKKYKRYRKEYPGERKGISEEMRFVAMRLRSTKKTTRITKTGSDTDASDREIDEDWVNKSESENEVGIRDVSDESISTAAAEMSGGGVRNGETWEPTVEGFVNYLVNSKLVFDTIESIVNDSSDVSYVYFRNTGLERSESLSKDLEWFRQQNVMIPEPSKPGISYAKYLKEISETNPPFFLSHFYNIHFSHIAGGQVITNEEPWMDTFKTRCHIMYNPYVGINGSYGLEVERSQPRGSIYCIAGDSKQGTRGTLLYADLNEPMVSKRIFEGRKLEFCRWQENEEELLRVVRVNLNMLGEHWSRKEKNKCLAEANKAFRYLGQIVRLIIA